MTPSRAVEGFEPQRPQRGTEKGINEVSGAALDAALSGHKQLGPGLLENDYEACLKYELHKRGVSVRSQVELPVIHDSVRIDVGYRLDLLVEERVVVEIKAVEKVTPVHEAQLLSYLKLGGFKGGLLINLNVLRLKDGIKRMVNNL